jgi:hypothetical protein
MVAEFIDRHSGGFNLPVPAADLIRMIEKEADDLDMYADLPEELDGYREFFRSNTRGPDREAPF